jgi:hypothetical protein
VFAVKVIFKIVITKFQNNNCLKNIEPHRNIRHVDPPMLSMFLCGSRKKYYEFSVLLNSKISAGWQSNALQILSNVLKRMAIVSKLNLQIFNTNACNEFSFCFYDLIFSFK